MTAIGSTKVRVGESDIHGIGVFATASIDTGDIVEVCPVLILDAGDIALVDRTRLYDFYYGWPEGQGALALGYGSLYNHSADPNADYEKDPWGQVIRVRALRPIAEGEEVTVDYSRGGTNPLWFSPKPG